MTAFSAKSHQRQYLAIVTIILTAVGILVPVGWDYWKSRAVIQLQRTSSVEIISNVGDISKLEIRYDGKAIKNVSRSRFVLVNLGRRAITREATVRFPAINLSGSAELLDAKIDRTVPDTIKASTSIENNSVSVSYDLLNPGDVVECSILTSGSDARFAIDGRIVDVSTVEYWDRTAEIQNPRTIPKTFYVVIVAGAILVILVFECHRERNLGCSALEHPLLTPGTGLTKTMLVSALQNELFPALFDPPIAKITLILKDLQANEEVGASQYSDIQRAVRDAAKYTMQINAKGLLIIWPLLIIASTYIAITLVRVFA